MEENIPDMDGTLPVIGNCNADFLLNILFIFSHSDSEEEIETTKVEISKLF